MRWNLRDLLISLGLLILAAALRWRAALDDLWLDEIWSWGLVQTRVKSALDVVLALQHDNNHFLNSWWIYALGPDAAGFWYRLPAVVLGSLTVLLARQAVADSGPVAVRAVTVLTLPSYLLVHYSSEARGYAYQLCFGLAAYVVLQSLLRTHWPAYEKSPTFCPPARLPKALFAGCCLLGGLGHAGFFLMFAAFLGWAAWATLRTTQSWFTALRWLTSVFAGPAVFLALLWLVNLSRLQIGGGPHGNPWLVANATLSLMVGGPEFGDGALLVGALAAVAVFTEIVLRGRAGDDRWVCWLLMMLVPAAIFAITGRKEVFPRYFLGSVLFFDLVLAHLAARCAASGIPGRVAVAALLTGTLIGNGWHLARLFRDGRGHAQGVVEYLRDHSASGPILIGSDHRFRHELVLDFHSRRLGLRERLIHFGDGPWPPEGPQWILLHRLDQAPEFEPTIVDPQGRRYELRRTFVYAGLSGWHTGVYERQTAKKSN